MKLKEGVCWVLLPLCYCPQWQSCNIKTLASYIQKGTMSIYNFQQRMSRLPQRWRTQRNAICNANCKTSWIIKTLNAHCAAGICPAACLSECPWTPLSIALPTCRQSDCWNLLLQKLILLQSNAWRLLSWASSVDMLSLLRGLVSTDPALTFLGPAVSSKWALCTLKQSTKGNR